MKRTGRDSRLSERERVAIRKALRARDEGSGSRIARIGRALTHPKNEAGDVRGYRFGIALCVAAIFQMVMVAALPDGEGRWLFFAFAWLTMLLGGWKIEKALGRD